MRGPLLGPPDRRAPGGAAATHDQVGRLGDGPLRRRRLQARELDDAPDRDRGVAGGHRRAQAEGRRPARHPHRPGRVRRYPRHGRGGRSPEGRRRARAAGAARGRARVVWRGPQARAARVADGHRPGRPHVPRRGRGLDRRRDQAHRHDLCRRAADALPRAAAGVRSGDGVRPRRPRGAGGEAAGPRAGGVAWARLGRGGHRGAARRARASPHTVRVSDAPTEGVAELYAAPPAEFTARRDALAKELRSSDRAAANAIKKLRKPSVSAAAVNRLARSTPDDVEALLAAGEALRQAQLGGGDRDAIRAAARDEREAVEKLVGEAGKLSAAVLEEVRETLHAAATDEEARELVRRGVLTEARRAVGLGGFGVAAPEPSPAPAPAKKKSTTAQRRKEAE